LFVYKLQGELQVLLPSLITADHLIISGVYERSDM
jgi:hypothetical protein